MRLSDAIAMGRMLLKPRAYTTILGDEGCALGMAMAAHGCRSHQEAIAKANSLTNYSWMHGYPNPAPCKCTPGDDYLLSRSRTYQAYIAHIFNEHVCGEEDWTMDQLIDWVRSVEPAEDVPSGT